MNRLQIIGPLEFACKVQLNIYLQAKKREKNNLAVILFLLALQV